MYKRQASECEPLLYTDYTILKEHIGLVVSGAEEVAKALGAGQVLLCMKKHTASRLHISDGQGFGDFTQVKQLPDVYPMGDEVIMIYQALGRVAVSYTHLQDFEIADILSEYLNNYRIAAGRANLLGFLPPHSAVALGLALSD